MPRNIEIEARIGNVEALAPKAAAIADRGPIEIVQDDTFIVCSGGRLRLVADCTAARTPSLALTEI